MIVLKNDNVLSGDIIALSGNSGSTKISPRLFFAIRKLKVTYNPLECIVNKDD